MSLENLKEVANAQKKAEKKQQSAPPAASVNLGGNQNLALGAEMVSQRTYDRAIEVLKTAAMVAENKAVQDFLTAIDLSANDLTFQDTPEFNQRIMAALPPSIQLNWVDTEAETEYE